MVGSVPNLQVIVLVLVVVVFVVVVVVSGVRGFFQRCSTVVNGNTLGARGDVLTCYMLSTLLVLGR